MKELTELTGWRKSVLKVLNLNSNKIARSTGLPIYHVNRWLGGYAVPGYVEMTINSFYDELDKEFKKVKSKLHLN